MFINARYMCWQEEKVEVPRLRILASPETSQVTESAPWMENMIKSFCCNDWRPLEIITKKIVQNFNTQQEEKQRSVKVNCRLSPGILLSLHRQTEVNVCRLLLSLSHPTMMRMKEMKMRL